MADEVNADSRRELLEQALLRLRETRAQLAEARQAQHEPIAVIGAGVRAPGGIDSMDALWQALCAGRDAVTPMVDSTDGGRPAPEDRPENGRWAGLLSHVDGLDAQFLGIAAPEAAYIDPQQRLVLETAWEAIEDADLPIERLRAHDTGVFVGLYGSDYLGLQLAGLAEITAYTAPGSAHCIAANRLSYLLDLRGPSIAVDSACSSSLVAVHLACRALRAGDCDYALAGGVNVILSLSSTQITEKVLPMAPDGRCRTFDARANGIVRAEGAGTVLLARLSDAVAQRLPVRGVIRGTAINHNGRTNGLTAPNPRAQQSLARRAVDDAGADARDVVYIEAHGTGTQLGDPIEVEALREAYGAGDTRCAIGSVKTNFGHQEAASGISGLLKALLVLEHGQVPPHLHFEALNPEIELAGTRFFVPTAGLAALPGTERDLAAVSSFGFGGANAHAVLAPPPPPAAAAPADDPARLVLPLSARSAPALGELARRYADVLAAGEDAAAVCARAAVGRTHHPYRLCLHDSDSAALAAQLRAAPTARLRPADAVAPRLAFVFSGQGSQWPAMGRGLLATYTAARTEILECDQAVRELAGWSVVEELSAPPEHSRLDETAIAQVCIGVLQLGLVSQLRAWGVRPAAAAGHSMGEIIACVATGVLERIAALELLLRRAALTERGARGGAMLTVALPVAQVESMLAGVKGRIGIGAVNGPRSTVVTGEESAVGAVESAARELGVPSRRLPVEYAFHSPLLDAVADELVAHSPQASESAEIPLYSTVTGGRADLARIDGAHWRDNLRERVAFAPAIEAMARAGIGTFLEIGPHPVLRKDILETAEQAGATPTVIGTLRRDQPAALFGTVAQLYEAGLDINWPAVTGYPRTRPRLPGYPWQRSRHWLTPARERPAAEVSDISRAPVPEPEPPADATELLGYIRQRLAEAQGISSAENVSVDQPLDGLSSLMIVELKNQVERDFGITVPLQVLLGGGTPMTLAAKLAAGMAADQHHRDAS